MDYNLYPKREHQLKWIRTYLEEAARLRGKFLLSINVITCNVMIDGSKKRNDLSFFLRSGLTVIYGTVNSPLADTLLLRTLAITDKIQIPSRRGLTGNDSRYY